MAVWVTCVKCQRLIRAVVRGYKKTKGKENEQAWYPIEHELDDGKLCRGATVAV